MKMKRRSMRHRHLWFSVWSQDPLRIMVVDDEEEIRLGIIKKIDWEANGFVVVGDAENGQDALDWETKLKRMYKEYQYKGPDILSSGNTELFTEDIIAMWDSN